jgi:GT2 family glycosyltransferase
MPATAVVVGFHRPESLAELLRGLDDPALRRVVVNVEADSEVRAVAEVAGATVVDLPGNPGYAAAVNAGAAVADDGVVVFLNDDCRIDARDLLHLAAVVATGEADVAVPRVLDGDGVLERTISAVPTPKSLLREWAFLPDHPVGTMGDHVRVEKWRAPRAPERIEAAAAVVVATRRDLLLAHPLPEEYFLYWEESDWFWHLRAEGAVVQYRPDATCVHVGGRDDVRPDKSRLLARNAVRCIRRTQGRAAGLAAIGIVIVWNLRLVVTDLLRMVVRPSSTRRSRLGARWAGLAAACTSWGELR